MPDWLSAGLAGLLALLIASVISGWQLLSSRYPNTWFLFTPRKSKALYPYCLLYGIAAFVITVSFNALVSNGIIAVEGLRLESPWLRALIIGLIARGIAQISLLDVTAGTKTISVGPAFVFQLVEPWLLTKIQQDEDSELRRYVRTRLAKHSGLSLNDVRQRVVDAPHSLDDPEHIALKLELDETKSREEAMEKHVRMLGRKSFNTAFPSKDA